MSSLWESARVAEPMGLSEAEHSGAFILNTGESTILSQSPAEDFEINTNVIQGWKIIFVDAEQTIGELDYEDALKKLQPYQLDQQNGSLLIKALSRAEVDKLLEN